MASSFEQRRFYRETCVGTQEDASYTSYTIQCPDGTGLVTCRQVFPGIEISINNFRAHSCLECYDEGDPFQLDFCCSGRFACDFSHRETCIVEPGALAVHHADRTGDMEGVFPLGHYQGVNLTVNFEQAAYFASQQFGVLAPNFSAIQKRLLSESWFRVWRADVGCAAILREMSGAVTGWKKNFSS